MNTELQATLQEILSRQGGDQYAATGTQVPEQEHTKEEAAPEPHHRPCPFIKLVAHDDGRLYIERPRREFFATVKESPFYRSRSPKITIGNLRDGMGHEIGGEYLITRTNAFADAKLGDRVRFRATIVVDRTYSFDSRQAWRLRLFRPARLPDADASQPPSSDEGVDECTIGPVVGLPFPPHPVHEPAIGKLAFPRDPVQQPPTQ